MKKPILYIGIGIGLIAISLLAILILNSNPTGKSNNNMVQPIEPDFVKEGFLLIRDEMSWVQKKEVDIEIADTEERIEVGLMYRKSMKESQAMLFVFDRAEPRSFWMRNTFMPLDLIFADETQKIIRIHRNAQPMSDTSMPSGKPAQYVLEVVAGFCEKYGVKEGDVLEYTKTKKPA